MSDTTAVRLDIPDEYSDQIKAYQEAFKKRFNVKLTKQQALIRAIKEGLKVLVLDTNRLEKELSNELKK